MATGSKKDDKAEERVKRAHASAAKASPTAPPVEDEEESDEDDGDEDEDGDEGDARNNADKAPEAPKAPPGNARTRQSAARASTPALRPEDPAPVRQSGMLKSGAMFIGIVVVLGLGFAFLGRERGTAGPKPEPKWKPGQTVDVELTLVATDRKNLACASQDTVGGLHCEFDAPTKRWAKAGEASEKEILKPYTVADGSMQLTAAGLWSDPALTGNLPAARFTVKCKYTVKGRLKNPDVRWDESGPWYPQQKEWYAGSISGCTRTGS